MEGKELFRRTKNASWSIRRTQYGERDNDDDDTYAYHNGCKLFSEMGSTPWSWFIGEKDGCYNCHAKVPDYIQALVRLYEGK
ncbi:hypothetical protein LCGC14_2923860 [marine sediment metagenome]|uniref:Uncharacterized protein n=1 Tax=marine sediment metagenome TaxID=412755 RepID=A0A0F8XN49_9ZZZZ